MKTAKSPLHTGFVRIDTLTKGLSGGELICIASPPGAGKTALAINIASNVALARKPLAVCIFSQEYTRFGLMQRLIAARANVSLQKIQSGAIKRRRADLKKAAELLSNAPLYISDRAMISADQIGRISKQLQLKVRKSNAPLGLIVIDYLQLVNGVPAGNRIKEIRNIASTLKRWAQKLDVPILVFSQCNGRGGIRRGYYSSQLEVFTQEADTVAFLRRPRQINSKANRAESRAEIIFTRSRRGVKGRIGVHFNPETVSFRSAPIRGIAKR